MEEPIEQSQHANTDSTAPATDAPAPGFTYFPFFKRKQAAFILVIVGIIFNCTSLYNEYALDDGIIIHQNNYVLKGISGIGDILSRDAYDAFYRRMHASDQLQGGRYRPLSAVSFAIEQEVIGTYRSGYYQRAQDLNNNGKLDEGPVSYTWAGANNDEKGNTNISLNHETKKTDVQTENEYEYNNFVDLNTDGEAQPNECYNCWDLNRNFKNDPEEDLNRDGVFNEIDCQVYGAPFRHFNTIWLYVLACVLFYVFLSKYALRNRQDLAFLAALLFLAHPIHSSVVANIKSRDEILSVLFICITLIFSFRFLSTRKPVALLVYALAFFLTLMSKEYGLVLYILVPVAIHVFTLEKIGVKQLSLPFLLFIAFALTMIFHDMKAVYYGLPPLVLFLLFVLVFTTIVLTLFRRTFKENATGTLMVAAYIGGLFYLALRLNAVNMAPGVPDTEILNNPYLLASGSQKFATEVVILLRYLRLAVFPHPLISDYSYASFPYSNITDWKFILSVVLNLAIIVTGIVLVKKRHVLGFAIVCYYGFLAMVGNFFFFIGTTMGEQLLFHSTIGFSLAAAWLILRGLDTLRLSGALKRNALMTFLLLLLVLYGAKTWERNWDWKNDVTLFLKDVKNQPNSVLILGNAGARWIDLADTKEITGVDLPGINNVPNDYNGQLKITDADVAAGGYNSKRDAALYRGIGYLKRATELHPRYVNGYLNLGLAFYKLGKFQDAILNWKLAERLYPDNPYLALYYSVYTGQLRKEGADAFNDGDYAKAVTLFTRWTIVTPNNPDAWYELGKALFKQHKTQKARECWQKTLQLSPDRKDAREMLQMVENEIGRKK